MGHPFKHFNTVMKHKWFVFKYAYKMHIPFTGLIHDTSKFSFTEFHRSSKYYTGYKSPTITEREDNDGISWICLHHALKNKHHWHAYIDFLADHIVIAPINFRHSVEYVCDVLSANRVYKKKSDFKAAYEYFKKDSEIYFMHPRNKEFILWCLEYIMNNKFKGLKKKILKNKYNEIMKKYPNSIIMPYNDMDRAKYLSIKE